MDDRDIHVKVIKAETSLRLPSETDGTPGKVHMDRAGEWLVEKDVRVHAVSIPEQSEISIYADIEVSTSPEMYLEKGHIFRAKYAGPAIQGGPEAGPRFAGSNITNTNIVFPSGTSIGLKAEQRVFVHLDLINHSPFVIEPMTQDVYVYYSYQSGSAVELG